ncbi:MAG: glycosyltransferase family 39 protein [Anaerolineae bacterium]
MATVSAAWFRLYHLDRLPPGLSFDEAINGINALSVIGGARPVFFDYFNREAIYMYMVGIGTDLLGRSALALRLPAALTSALTVPLLYVSIRQVFRGALGPERSALLASLSSLFLALSFCATAMGRIGYRANTLPPIVLLALVAIWQASSRSSAKWAAVGGLACGLGWYAYLAGRLLPAFGFAALVLAHVGRRAERRAGFARILLAYTGAATLTVLPVLLHFAGAPGQLLGRTGQAVIQGPLVPTLLSNALDHLGFWFWRGDFLWRQNLPYRPFFDPLTAFLAGIGLLLFLWHARCPSSPFAHVLVALAVMAVPCVFSDGPVDSARAFGMVPLAVILPAYCLECSCNWARRRWPGSWTGAWVPPFAVAAIFVFSGVRTYRDYFQVWAEQVATVKAFDDVIAETAIALNSQARVDAPVVVPVHSEVALSNDVLQYLYTGQAPLLLINTQADGASQRVADLCHTYGHLQLVDWQWEALGGLQATHGDPQGAIIQALRRAGAVEVSQADIPSASLRRYDCVGTQAPQEPLSVLPSAVTFGGGQVTLEQARAGMCQSSTGSQPGRVCIWLTLEWERDSVPLGAALAVSIRVSDQSGDELAQSDTWLVDERGRQASQWESGESVWSYHVVEWDETQPLSDSVCPKVIVYDPLTLAAIGHSGEPLRGNPAELGLGCLPARVTQ